MGEIPTNELAELKRKLDITNAAETAYELAKTLSYETCSDKGDDLAVFWNKLNKLVQKQIV